jgi:glutamate racemase
LIPFYKIKQFIPQGVNVLAQGKIVADSLQQYLQRHTEIDEKCSKNAQMRFFTTDATEDFDSHAANFYGKKIKSSHLNL